MFYWMHFMAIKDSWEKGETHTRTHAYTHTHTHTHTHILVFGVNRGPWKIHTNNRRTRTRMSDIVRGIVDFAHLTWGPQFVCEIWSMNRGRIGCMLYLCCISTFSYIWMHVELTTISTISPIRGRPRLVARPLSECRMSEQGPRFPANTHSHTHTHTHQLHVGMMISYILHVQAFIMSFHK